MSETTIEARQAAGLRPLAFDRLGTVIVAIAAYGVLLQPFVLLRPNRIAAAHGLALGQSLPLALMLGCAGLLAAFAGVTALRSPAPLRLAAAAAALAAIAVGVGLAAGTVAPPGNPFARVSPGAGFWICLFALALALADALVRLSFGPLARVAALAVAALCLGLLLASGLWDGLSLLKEYAARADAFWREAEQHVVLAVGSLGAAVAVGLPLGILCQRRPGLRAAVLPVLNVIQTFPSIAMFGILMVPLGLLASAVPALAALGIRGIGTAPAVIALFLYSLLPVVANTAVGLDQVPASAVDAARGMGMTRAQRLFSVELPLALPVILTGIRIVLVQNIGLVTIAALIGGGGFGTFVFQGLGQTATDLVLLGTLPTIALAFAAAVLLDAAIDLLRRRP